MKRYISASEIIEEDDILELILDEIEETYETTSFSLDELSQEFKNFFSMKVDEAIRILKRRENSL